MAFAQMLEMLMERDGFSKYRLAKELGIHQTSIANWMSGTACPRHNTLKAVADKFEVSIEYLVGSDPEAKADYILYEIKCLQEEQAAAKTDDEIETIDSRINILEFEYKDLTGYFPDERIKKSAPSEDEAVSMAFPTDLVRLTDKDQRDLYKIFSAAVSAKNITEGFAVSHANVDVTMLIRLQARYLSMAKRSELIRLANFLEVQDAALPLIQELPALEENLAAIYRQLHDQIDRIGPDDILTVSEVLQALTKSRKK